MEQTYKIYSFDIFDTLLFRTIRDIREIYIKTFRDNPMLFPSYIDENEWANIRQAIEKKARNYNKEHTGSTEIMLKEAYDYLPSVYKNKYEIAKAEYQTEKKLCYLNPEIYDCIKKIKKENSDVRVILISDMYYDSEQLKELLESAGCDMEYIDELYVSCENGASKKYKKLYNIVLEKEGVKPSEMLHTGDNEYSDYSIPKLLGIDARLYDVISNAENKHSFLKLEKLLYGDTATEFYSIRNLVSSINSTKYSNAEKQFWYNYGIMIMGPLCTGAAEWVLDCADENNINAIFPLMREAKFLCKLLECAAMHRVGSYDIKPLYVSRKSVFLPSLEKVSFKDINYVCTSNGIKIKDVFFIFGIEEYIDKFKGYEEIEIASAYKISFEHSNLRDVIYELLNSEEVKSKIKINALNEKKKILEYLNNIGLDKPYITFDMGWRGYTQLAIDKILKSGGIFSKSLNLLIAGRSGALENILEGCDIRGYVSNFGKNQNVTIELFSRIYELFYICDEGTTVGYKQENDKIIPVTKEINYEYSAEIDNMLCLQEGVLTFQKFFYKLAENKENLYNVFKRPEALCSIVSRSLATPTCIETEYMGALFYDQNFGADNQYHVIEKDTLIKFKKSENNAFWEYDNFRNIEWFSGLFSASDPLFYFKEAYKRKYDYTVYKRVFFTERIINQCNNKKIVLVGGGIAVKDLLFFIKESNANIDVTAIIDNDKSKHGTFVNGIKIISMKDTVECDCYVITTFSYIEELERQIYNEKGTEVEVIHYRKGDI